MNPNYYTIYRTSGYDVYYISYTRMNTTEAIDIRSFGQETCPPELRYARHQSSALFG